MSDATLARMEHGKYVGVRGEPRRDGVCVHVKPYDQYVRTLLVSGSPFRAQSVAFFSVEETRVEDTDRGDATAYSV